ncbi:MAG TPA: phosphoenolpyruvate synthase, partial [Thiolapillus brandeum]|nr:phosphoenolpyruvate synthase [Thiolapillus brandeum]
MKKEERPFLWFREISMEDVPLVGGKNASLGEMIANLSAAGVRVPGGFATTAHAFREFMRVNGLDERIDPLLDSLDVSDVKALAETGRTIRSWIEEAPLQPPLEAAIREAYEAMGSPAVAVRSSATAEDLPEASFAGQQETYLNVRGIDQVLAKVRQVFASLYNDRAIAYRVHQGFSHREVALSAGIQKMARSDLGASGVMFTLDTESGFDQVVFINAAWGLGETVVQGAVNPDEFYVYKPNLAAGRPAILRRSLGEKAIRMIYDDDGETAVKVVETEPGARSRFALDDTQVEELARYGMAIEGHYGRPMDIEWALDGEDGLLYILQARPETVQSRQRQGIEEYVLKERGKVLCQGRAIGQRIGQGTARVVEHASEMERVQPGDVLVTDMTDPDWEPIMKRASAIVTNRGGRTCHAAIIAREMGIPAVVGCGDATEAIAEGTPVTVSCAEGDDGFIYEGLLEYEVHRTDPGQMPRLPVKIMMNVASPARAFAFAQLPNEGVGLARLEFIINNTIGIHPRALLEFDAQPEELKQEIAQRTAGYGNPHTFYVE